MVAFSAPPNLKRLVPSLPTGGGVVAGLAAAVAALLIPGDLRERLVWTSGIASLIPAAQPPLGGTARVLLALGGGIAIGAVCWAALFLLIGPGGPFARDRRRSEGSAVRRGDAHPDAPPRRPITAADLATPFVETPARPPAVQPLPADLDQPLAAFDPDAIPATPREPSRPPAPLTPPLAPGERIETFALAAPPPPTVTPTRREPGAPPPSIDALLRRLEAGAARRPRPMSAA